MIQHISLDYWNTIARANSDYADDRTRYISNIFSCDPDAARAAYTRIKMALDKQAEMGFYSSWEANLSRLRNEFETDHDTQRESILGNVFEEIFICLPPHISPDILLAIRRAHDYGLTVSIASNTNFIRGRVLAKTLKGLPLSFSLYSDEVQCVKPSRDFFKRVIGRAMHCNQRISKPKHIVHIGDNQICDGGAKDFGMVFEEVNGPEDTVDVINCYLESM